MANPSKKHIRGQKGNTYEIIDEIGRGTFGIVYRVRDKSDNIYAMKVIAPISDPEMRLSFEQEIKSTIGLSHENILSVFDYGSYQQGLFVITEYCPDGNYRSILTEYAKGWPGMDIIIHDIKQVLSGLSVLHSRIIHRDLKPQNILLKDEKLKITDFGLAKFVDEATRTLTFKGGGTPLYMAPEVWLMQRTTPATDLYAVGVMFFEAVAGRPPYRAKDINQLQDKHLYSPIPRAKRINNDVPDIIDGIITKLLAKEPHKRYQTAREVIEALSTIPVPPAGGSDISEIVNKIRQHHDAEEQRRLEEQKRLKSEEESLAKNRYKEQEILDLIDDVVSEINKHLPETKIQISDNQIDREYRFGNRSLHVHFFAPEELYRNPEVPARMEILEKHHVVHGGYIEIKENGQDREGWNLVLMRPPESIYGEWHIVETRVSATVPRRARYTPFATKARLFADNLACHLAPMLHVYNLTEKVLERSDILKIIKVFVPEI